jgi:hypothetical protein
MIQTIKNIWRVMRKVMAVIVFLSAFIQSGGFIQGLNYLLDGGEFVDVGGVMVISGLIAAALIVVGLIIWPGKGKLEVEKGGQPKSVASPRRPVKKTPQATKGQLNNDDAPLVAIENIARAPSELFGKQFFKGSSASAEDTYQAGSLALMREDFQTAKDLFMAAESEGHGAAVYNLFAMYGGGCLSPYDIDQAVHYWRKAAEQNHPIAKKHLFMLEDADQGKFGVQASVKYAGLPAAPGFLSPFLITSACRSLVAACKRHGATSDVIAYELDAASSSEKPMVLAFIERTGVAREVYRGGMDRLEEKSPADWVTDGLNELFFAMRRNGIDEDLCLIARCTMVGYLILKSELGSQSYPLLGVREFVGVVTSDSEDLDDEIPF